MQAATFYRTVTVDEGNLLDRLLEMLDRTDTRYCVIGGQGVNAYVAPLVSLDLDVVVAVSQLDEFARHAAGEFRVERFPFSVNLSLEHSDLRVQLQTDPRYADFVDRRERRTVLGRPMWVASLEDVLRGKVWAVQDTARRASKRQKDLADIARLIETYPGLLALVPAEVQALLI